MKNKYEIRGDVTAIYIRCRGKEHECLIDTSKLGIVLSHPRSWRGIMKGKIRKRIYAEDRKGISVHRLIAEPPKGMVVDHINHNCLDNRCANLRIVTHAENLQNTSRLSSNNRTGIRGITSLDNNWIVNINKKNYYFNVDKKDEAIRFNEVARAIEMPYSQEALELKLSEADIEFYNEIKERGGSRTETTRSGSEVTSSRRSNMSSHKWIHFHTREKKWRVRFRVKGAIVFEREFKSLDDAIAKVETLKQQHQSNKTG